jgi:beta-galactosidase
MRMRHLVFVLYHLLFLYMFIQPLSAGNILKGNKRVKYNFNPGWKMYTGDPEGAEMTDFNDSAWKTVTLPHAFNEDEAFRKSIHELTTGIVWYRKHFKVPANHKEKKIFLEFEGIRQAGEFYLNGQYIGLHENGVMAFGFDITEQVNYAPEDNVIAVRIDNSWDYKEKSTGQPFQWNNNNFNASYGGIPKNTYLHVTDRLYQTLPLFSTLETTGVYIYASEIDISRKRAKITAESQVRNEYDLPGYFQYEVVIKDNTGNTMARFINEKVRINPGETMTVSASAMVENLEFWSWGYGYLYNVFTILKVDSKNADVVMTKTGFRKTGFHDGMVFLNDRVIQLKGYAQRTSNEWPAIGMSVPAWVSDFSNRMIVKGNGNLVRWMHVTPWKQDIESCDRMGLIQAMPAGDAEKDVNDRRWGQRVSLMRDAIIYNRNNPSIIFYECGNESISEEHMQEMKDLRNKYDPHGGRAIGSREMLDSKVAEYGGEMLYINKSAREPMWAMEYMRDEGLRKYWDNYSPPYHVDGAGPLYRNQDASAYNRNQDSYAIEIVRRWYDYWRERPGTGKRVSSGGANIIFSDSNTHFRGEENYRRSGEVDPLRIPKDGYFAHRAMWDGWVDTEKHHTYILGHWNYNDTTVKNVYVISTGDKVELKINDVSCGFGEQSHRFLFTFKNIQWLPGTLEAVSYDTNGKILGFDLKRTSGKPAGIRLTLHTAPGGLKADGADLAIIDIEVVDSLGNRCPASNQLIHFTLEGPAEWRGGLAQGPDNYILSKSLPVECGINRILIRSTDKAGKIILNAASEELKSASVMFKSKPVKVKDGLSMDMPGENLPSYLKRGPAPGNPSFGITRIPIGIKSAAAGANIDDACKSYDDNELTEWTNDGRIATGWIKYELTQKAEICEVEMKLSGWRSRRYPIRILIDNKEVYNDTTSRSLGYITIPFEPVSGQTVSIELIGAHVEKDAFENIVEISGQKELDLYREPPRDYSGQLRIVEVEFYEKPVTLQHFVKN